MPTAVLTLSLNAAQTQLTVDASASTTEGPALSYNFNFGAGYEGWGATPIVVRTITTPGVKTVRLKVRTSPGVESPEVASSLLRRYTISELKSYFDSQHVLYIADWDQDIATGHLDSNKLYNMQLVGDGYLSMYEATGDITLIEKCLVWCETTIANARVYGTAQNPYTPQWPASYKDGYPDWLDPTLLDGTPSLLNDLQFGTFMSRCAALIKLTPSLNAVYGTRASAVSQWAYTNLLIKYLVSRKQYTLWIQRPNASLNHYSDKQIHMARMGVYLWLCGHGTTPVFSDGKNILEMAQAMALKLKNLLEPPLPGGEILWESNLVPAINGVPVAGHYHPFPDTGHREREARLIMDFVELPARFPSLAPTITAFDQDDIDGVALTFVNFIWNGIEHFQDPRGIPIGGNTVFFSNYIDGSQENFRDRKFVSAGHPHDGTYDGFNGFVYNYGWICFGRYNDDAQRAGEALLSFIQSTPNSKENAIRQRNGSQWGKMCLPAHLALNLANRAETNEPPVAVLSVDPVSGPAPLAVLADGSSSTDPNDDALEYRFDFGSGWSSWTTSSTASYVFPVPGSRMVRLQVRDTEGLESTIVTQDIEVQNSLPSAVLSLSVSVGSAPLTVTASGSGSSDPDGQSLVYRFDFGAGFGAYSSVASAQTTYSTPGVKTIRLQVRDALGGESSVVTQTLTVTPSQPPVAVLDVTPTSGLSPLDVVADGAASTDPEGAGLVYRFDFGSGFGSYSSSSSANHTYTSPGAKTVRLQVRDDQGIESSIVSKQVLVDNALPIASMSVTPSSGPAPLTIVVDASQSSDPEDSVLEYSFDFGSGFEAYTSLSSVTYVYMTPGVNTVRLRVRDSSGGVSDIVTSDVEVTNAPPVASLNLSVSSGDVPLEVVFDASASSDPDDPSRVFPLSYSFDFGLGNGFEEWVDNPVAERIYENSGSYLVRLKVKDQFGLESSVVSESITVTTAPQRPVAVMQTSPIDGVVPFSVSASLIDSFVPSEDGQSPGQDGTTNLEGRIDFGFGFSEYRTVQIVEEYTYGVGGSYQIRGQVRDVRTGLESDIVSSTVTAADPVLPLQISMSAVPSQIASTGGAVALRAYVGIGSSPAPGVSVLFSTDDGSPSSLIVPTGQDGIAVLNVIYEQRDVGSVFTVTAQELVSSKTASTTIRVSSSTESVELSLSSSPSRIPFNLLPMTVFFRVEVTVDGVLVKDRIVDIRTGDGGSEQGVTDKNGIAVIPHVYQPADPVVPGRFLTIAVSERATSRVITALVEVVSTSDPSTPPTGPTSTSPVSTSLHGEFDASDQLQRQVVANRFDVVASYRASSYVDELKSVRPDVVVLSRLNVQTVKQTDSWFSAEFLWGAYQHVDGSRLVDIQSESVRGQWISSLKDVIAALPDGLDGVVLDGAALLRSSDLVGFALPVGYDESSYYSAIEEIVSELVPYADIGVYVNGYRGGVDSSVNGSSLLSGAAGVFVQNLGIGDVVSNLSDVQDLVSDNSLNRVVIVGRGTTLQERMDAFVRYLLITDSKTSYTFKKIDSGSSVQLYPESKLDLGIPQGPFVNSGNHLSRSFEAGRVFFNPTDETVRVYVGRNTHFVLRLQGGGIWTSEGILLRPELRTDDVVLAPGQGAIVQRQVDFRRSFVQSRLAVTRSRFLGG